MILDQYDLVHAHCTLRDTFSSDRTISADIKPSPEFAQGLQMLLPQSKASLQTNQENGDVMFSWGLWIHQSSNVLLLWFHVPGTSRVVCCAFPRREGASPGQLDDNRNLNRHPLDMPKVWQASANVWCPLNWKRFPRVRGVLTLLGQLWLLGSGFVPAFQKISS